MVVVELRYEFSLLLRLALGGTPPRVRHRVEHAVRFVELPVVQHNVQPQKWLHSEHVANHKASVEVMRPVVVPSPTLHDVGAYRGIVTSLPGHLGHHLVVFPRGFNTFNGEFAPLLGDCSYG